MLSQIKQYINENKSVSLYDLSIHFDVSPDALEKMLEILINKGNIKKIGTLSCSSACSGCSTKTDCNPAKLIIYAAI